MLGEHHQFDLQYGMLNHLPEGRSLNLSFIILISVFIGYNFLEVPLL